MSRKRIEPESEFRPDPTRRHPPIDENVQLPHQVRRAAARADALSTGQPPRPIPVPKGRSQPTISLTDAEIDQALQRLDQAELKVPDPDFGKIVELLAREGARLIKAHRCGARQPRRKSDNVTRRLEALIQAYSELSPKRQQNHNGTQTLELLRKAVITKLGLRDDDKVISEDTIKKDIQQVRPLLRLIHNGIVTLTGKPITKEISERTRQEMEAGKRAVVKAAAASKPHRRSAR